MSPDSGFEIYSKIGLHAESLEDFAKLLTPFSDVRRLMKNERISRLYEAFAQTYQKRSSKITSLVFRPVTTHTCLCSG